MASPSGIVTARIIWEQDRQGKHVTEPQGPNGPQQPQWGPTPQGWGQIGGGQPAVGPDGPRPNWLLRHKVLGSALGAFGLILVIGLIGSAVKPVSTAASSPTVTAPTSAASSSAVTATTAAAVVPSAASNATPPVAPDVSATPSPAPAAADPVGECFARPPATGDVLFRSKNPGLSWQTQRLGGNYVYNHTVNECQDSVTWLLATIPKGPGYCGQVALASDNPTYDDTVAPAPPLKTAIAQGGACD